MGQFIDLEIPFQSFRKILKGSHGISPGLGKGIYEKQEVKNLVILSL
jgi:hypothetical protein